jgi:hypothetical protein
MEFYAKALRENYQFPRALNNLGNALREQNMIDKAIQYYE